MLKLFFTLSLHEQILFVYFIVINLVTFFFFAFDKYKASGDFRRTPEKVLWLLSLAGGSIGALAAMKLFRHKTKKHSFQAVLLVIILLQVAIVFFFLTSNLF